MSRSGEPVGAALPASERQGLAQVAGEGMAQIEPATGRVPDGDAGASQGTTVPRRSRERGRPNTEAHSGARPSIPDVLRTRARSLALAGLLLALISVYTTFKRLPN